MTLSRKKKPKQLRCMMKSTEKLFPITAVSFGARFASGKFLLIFKTAQCWNRELGNLGEGESQIFICRQWEIVLLTGSSFKTHVHLLHVVIVNQAFRLCAFSQVFHLPYVLALCIAVFHITAPCGNVHACVFAELKS